MKSHIQGKKHRKSVQKASVAAKNKANKDIHARPAVQSAGYDFAVSQLRSGTQARSASGGAFTRAGAATVAIDDNDCVIVAEVTAQDRTRVAKQAAVELLEDEEGEAAARLYLRYVPLRPGGPGGSAAV